MLFRSMQPTPRLPAQPRFANGGCRRLRCFSAGGVTVGLAICGFNCLFIFPPCYVALCASKAWHRFGSEKVSWCLDTSPPSQLPSQDVPNSCLSFCLLYFVLSSFKENGLPFWMPGVLCQRSEVVLWNLLSIQMLF